MAGIDTTMVSSQDLVNNELLNMSADERDVTIFNNGQRKEWVEQNLAHYDAIMVDPTTAQEKKIRLSVMCAYLRHFSDQMKEKVQQVSTKVDDRIARIDLGLKSETLSHRLDLNRLEETVVNLFRWTETASIRKEYLAPYVAIIQSSGMGKTKLLYEFLKENHKKMNVRLLLCTTTPADASTQHRDKVHEDFLIPQEPPSEESRKLFTSRLEAIVTKCNCKQDKIVFLVDEAQHLVKQQQRNYEEYEEGFYFRCFRNWLRTDRPDKKRIVAVFAGTTSKLTNFFVEKPSTRSSRDIPGTYYPEEGTKLYNPFFELTTSGAGKNDPPGTHQDVVSTEFRNSIRFGRPLFHVMNKEGLLNDDALDRIKRRLQIYISPDDKPTSWLSVLSVRVQMGQTTYSLVSTLVALGYANMTHFHSLASENGGSPILQHCHFPDPVLARAAMEIMNQDRKVWTDHARELFSMGLCTPAKGDIGEIAAALFMLFCGDELRMEINKKLETFAVPLQEWLKKMGATPIIQVADEDCREEKHVSFIQFCRNYVRLSPGEIANNQEYLRELHESACGIYMYSGAVACDLLAAVSCRPKKKRKGGVVSDATTAPNMASDMEIDGATEEENVGDDAVSEIAREPFEAMLVSVKNRSEFTTTQVGEAICAMVRQLRKAELDKGVCLLILVGLTNDADLTEEQVKAVKNKIELTLHPTQVTRSKKGLKSPQSGISCYVVIVKNADEYGVGRMLQCTTSPGGEHSEMYASHYSLAQLVERGSEKSVLRSSLRSRDVETDADLKYTTELSNALKGPPPPKVCDQTGEGRDPA